MADNFTEPHKMIIGFIDQLVKDGLEADSKKAVCQKGCNLCCNFLVPVTIMDVKFILQALENIDNEKKELILENLYYNEDIVEYTNEDLIKKLLEEKTSEVSIKCPFSSDGGCMVYENRPIACRLHNSSDISLCENYSADLSFHEVPEIKKILDICARQGNPENERSSIFLHNAIAYDEFDKKFIFNAMNQFNLSDEVEKDFFNIC
ncbi:MAG: YkgJ family cysteine cluster protein [Halarcobacter sp.]